MSARFLAGRGLVTVRESNSRTRHLVLSAAIDLASRGSHHGEQEACRRQNVAAHRGSADGVPDMVEAKCSLHSATRSSGGTRSSSSIISAVHTAVGTSTSTRSGHGHAMPSTHLDHGRRMLQDDVYMMMLWCKSDCHARRAQKLIVSVHV